MGADHHARAHGHKVFESRQRYPQFVFVHRRSGRRLFDVCVDAYEDALAAQILNGQLIDYGPVHSALSGASRRNLLPRLAPVPRPRDQRRAGRVVNDAARADAREGAAGDQHDQFRSHSPRVA